MSVDLSISIVNWNTRDLLDDCLRSIYETAADLGFEIIVVDNASSDGSQEMVRDKYQEVKLIANEANAGFARANNQAYEVSQGRHFLLLNSDTEVLDGALKTLVAWMDDHPEYGVCGPMLLNEDRSLQPSWAALPSIFTEAAGFMDRRVNGKDLSQLPVHQLSEAGACEVGWVGGACFLVRRSAIEQIGPMDEGYFMYCEETDWCWRMAKAGLKVGFVPQAQVVHLGGASSRMVPLRSTLRQEYSRMRFLWRRGWIDRLLLAPFAVLTAAKVAVRMLRSRMAFLKCAA